MEKPSPPITGTKYRLTRAAYSYIHETLVQASEQPDMRGMFALLSWTTEDVNNDLIPGPGLALDATDPSTHVPDDFYSVGEFKVYVTLDAKRVQECRDKVLDYRQKRLVLLYLDEIL